MDEERNDLHLTATGVGHQFRIPHEFPPSGFRRTVLDPLPPSLTHGEQVNDHFLTTTGSTHDYKPHGAPFEQPYYKKAPGSWKVHYSEDITSKLGVKPWRRPLTMGNQSSEMKDKYRGRPVVSLRAAAIDEGVQPPVLKDHHTEGPSKKLIPSTVNTAIAGQVYYPRDRGVLSYHSDAYLTTTQKDHRSFTKLEKGKYPKKQYATYWECEDYPKAWGHGSKYNPLPPNSVAKREGPMRDTMMFPTATSLPNRLPKFMTPVPNKGQMSLMRSTYTAPAEYKRRDLFLCPVPKPYNIEGPTQNQIFTVPKMYNTEYQYYGSKKPVQV